MTAVLKDDTEQFKQFMDNESFRRWMTDTVFGLTHMARGRWPNKLMKLSVACGARELPATCQPAMEATSWE